MSRSMIFGDGLMMIDCITLKLLELHLISAQFSAGNPKKEQYEGFVNELGGVKDGKLTPIRRIYMRCDRCVGHDALVM